MDRTGEQTFALLHFLIQIKSKVSDEAEQVNVSPAAGWLELSAATGVQREGQTGSASLTRSLAGL